MNLKAQALYLANCSLNEQGILDAQRVEAALAYIEKHFEHLQKLRIMQIYKKKISNIANAQKAHIEYCGALSQENLDGLKTFLQGKIGLNVNVDIIENQALLGGVKMFAADNVWENSIRLQIENLENTLK